MMALHCNIPEEARYTEIVKILKAVGERHFKEEQTKKTLL